MAMDLYTGLRLKLEDLRESGKPSARVPWHIVAMQLGQGDEDVPEEAEDFVDCCRAHLGEVLKLCPDTGKRVRDIGERVELVC